jgi:hypothetical protein
MQALLRAVQQLPTPTAAAPPGATAEQLIALRQLDLDVLRAQQALRDGASYAAAVPPAPAIAPAAGPAANVPAVAPIVPAGIPAPDHVSLVAFAKAVGDATRGVDRPSFVGRRPQHQVAIGRTTFNQFGALHRAGAQLRPEGTNHERHASLQTVEDVIEEPVSSRTSCVDESSTRLTVWRCATQNAWSGTPSNTLSTRGHGRSAGARNVRPTSQDRLRRPDQDLSEDHLHRRTRQQQQGGTRTARSAVTLR